MCQPYENVILSQSIIFNREIGDQFSNYIAAQRYSEAQSYAQLSLQTLKLLQNQTLYTAAAEVIETEIRNELKKKQDG